MLIVDPFQPGVVQAISSAEDTQLLGRLDLEDASSQQDPILATIEKIEYAVTQLFDYSAFTGILLANWEEKLGSECWRLVIKALRQTGLSVFLETAPPDFHKDRNALQPDSISGLVIRNASILPNGKKRDYFQLENVRPTIKAFVSEACMRDFVVVAWETIDDDASLSNASPCPRSAG
ncbi:hypothetical protein COL922a_014231 [Colletotrichum nupharicola]|nr:hypothetical protein COL922a_014231 [Colletotrichum nupharicola]